jgi:FkbM family methyltransferase
LRFDKVMVKSETLAKPFRRLVNRRDFRHNPVKALVKRAAWRLRWLGASEPMELRMNGGFLIAAPRGAAGALLFYLGNSEPESAGFISGFLKPGMVFFDVGAHIGEYTLIGSRGVGPTGAVHAFEAQPDTFALLKRNCATNRAENVKLNRAAVCERQGEVEFDISAEPAMSSMAAAVDVERKRARIRVPGITLDQYCQTHDTWPSLLKIDVEGAELLVLRGAADLLRRPPGSAPAIIFECVNFTYVRFGYDRETVVTYLNSFGYEVFRMAEDGALLSDFGQPGQSAGYNLVALKN